MPRGHLRVSDVVHFHGKVFGAACRSGERSISATSLRACREDPTRPALAMSIFGRGGRGAAPSAYYGGDSADFDAAKALECKRQMVSI
jgi:hypothetical protein